MKLSCNWTNTQSFSLSTTARYLSVYMISQWWMWKDICCTVMRYDGQPWEGVVYCKCPPSSLFSPILQPSNTTYITVHIPIKCMLLALPCNCLYASVVNTGRGGRKEETGNECKQGWYHKSALVQGWRLEDGSRGGGGRGGERTEDKDTFRICKFLSSKTHSHLPAPQLLENLTDDLNWEAICGMTLHSRQQIAA